MVEWYFLIDLLPLLCFIHYSNFAYHVSFQLNFTLKPSFCYSKYCALSYSIYVVSALSYHNIANHDKPVWMWIFHGTFYSCTGGCGEPGPLFTKRTVVSPQLRSRDILEPRFGFRLYKSLWNLTSIRQPYFWDACQISERCDHCYIRSRGFETLGNLGIRWGHQQEIMPFQNTRILFITAIDLITLALS